MGRMSPNMEKPGGEISETSAESLITQEETDRQRNIQNALRIRDGEPLPKGPLAPYKRKDMGEISENLV